MGRNQYWAGRVYDLCVYYMTGTPEGSTESGFMEKPGIGDESYFDYNGLSLRWIRVIKLISQKNIFFSSFL